MYDDFIKELAKTMKEQLKVGDGFDESVTIGPLINEKAVVKV